VLGEEELHNDAQAASNICGLVVIDNILDVIFSQFSR
jgi:tRNA U34 5-carboxymethylaminomethyl modifying GTPase MnmE/TrmE